MKYTSWKHRSMILLQLTILLSTCLPASFMPPYSRKLLPLQTQPMNLVDFSAFASQRKTTLTLHNATGAVVYTRVSSKEQADKNLSLETQRKAIEQYAERNNIHILGFFGGTYESAKTDGRKEFQRMLAFISEQQGRIGQILVYTLDRFSRTGGAAIKIASDLREQHGVSVFAVTQPTDTRNPSGILHQNIQLLFSEYDNQLRKQKAIAGLQEKFARGIWATRPPQGYDIVRSGGERKLVINEEGKLLARAFQWKYEGVKNEVIIERLRGLGLSMYKQQLCKIFKKPFYCGVINHGILNGKIVEGQHERLIEPAMFLAINKIKPTTLHGVPAGKENERLPLKAFVHCAGCRSPLTGYAVKKRGLYYYKCPTAGCSCNLNADKLHGDFAVFLQRIILNPQYHANMRAQLSLVLSTRTREYSALETQLKGKLTELQKKMDTLEEKYFVRNEVSKEIFEKFHERYNLESAQLSKQLANVSSLTTEVKHNTETGLERSISPFSLWQHSNVQQREKLGHLLFPGGVFFNPRTRQFSCPQLNNCFLLQGT